jgi:hypothetical protein
MSDKSFPFQSHYYSEPSLWNGVFPSEREEIDANDSWRVKVSLCVREMKEKVSLGDVWEEVLMVLVMKI